MKRGLAYTIAYVKNLLGLVSQEPVPQLHVAPPQPHKPCDLPFDEDISSNVGHFNFNKWRRLKETGGEINKEFYDGEGELIEE